MPLNPDDMSLIHQDQEGKAQKPWKLSSAFQRHSLTHAHPFFKKMIIILYKIKMRGLLGKKRSPQNLSTQQEIAEHFSLCQIWHYHLPKLKLPAG